MSTTTLAARAERSTAELASSARRHLAEAEQYAQRAAESAARAADDYGDRAARAADEYGSRAAKAGEQAADALGDQLSHLRHDVEEALEDPETRRLVTMTAGGVAVVGIGIWLWRRRKRRKQQDYETSQTDVSGWEDPHEALAAKGSTEVASTTTTS